MRNLLNTINRPIEAWLDVHSKLVRLLLPSSFEVKSDGLRAKNTSLDCLRIYSRPVTDEDHVCQTCGGPPGAKTVTYIWRSQGWDCNAVYATSRLPSLAALGNKTFITILYIVRLQHLPWSPKNRLTLKNNPTLHFEWGCFKGCFSL